MKAAHRIADDVAGNLPNLVRADDVWPAANESMTGCTAHLRCTGVTEAPIATCAPVAHMPAAWRKP